MLIHVSRSSSPAAGTSCSANRRPCRIDRAASSPRPPAWTFLAVHLVRHSRRAQRVAGQDLAMGRLARRCFVPQQARTHTPDVCHAATRHRAQPGGGSSTSATEGASSFAPPRAPRRSLASWVNLAARRIGCRSRHPPRRILTPPMRQPPRSRPAHPRPAPTAPTLLYCAGLDAPQPLDQETNRRPHPRQ